jgi:hypothetical protein
MSTKR